MKAIRKIILLCLIIIGINSQAQDTTRISMLELADSVFGNLSMGNIPSGRLSNRLFVSYDSTASYLFSQEKVLKPITADNMYQLMIERKNMSYDTTDFPWHFNIFQEAMAEMNKEEYEDARTVLPLSIMDFEYQIVDERNPNLERNNLQLFDQGINSANAFTTRKAFAIGPLFDYLSDDVLYLLIKDKWVFSDREISKIEIYHQGKWNEMFINKLFPFYISGKEEQVLTIQVSFDDGEVIERKMMLKTPGASIKQKSLFSKCDRGETGNTSYVSGPAGNRNKLKWCIIYGCGNKQQKIIKPFYLVAGYRPPIFGHSFEDIYKSYNDHYGYLLERLHRMGYDVILVYFNYNIRPYKHGIQESAELFERFILDMNNEKYSAGSYYENIIQANSLAADVVRLALMNIDKKHFEENKPHHHSRLYIAVDAQFYGANIPLSLQYMVNSHVHHISPIDLVGGAVGGTLILGNYMYAAFLSRGALETIQYSPWAGNFNFPFSPWTNHYIQPTHHWRRTGLLNALAEKDRNNHIIPMQLGTRNIAISMGKYDKPNYEDGFISDDGYCKAPGHAYIHTFFKMAKAAKYTNNHFEIFRRRSFFGYIGIPFTFTDQRFHVRKMYPVDGTSGSYHNGKANVAFNFRFMFDLLGGLASIPNKDIYTHKTVLSALAINPDIWPNSHHINMHDLKLMWNKRDFNVDDDNQSPFYGYPNLGRPNDHYKITPFDAIYVDNKPDPHIDMEGQDYVDELMEFYMKEIEPSHLYLQNMNLGEQANENSTYIAYRRAKDSITFSYDLSPMTDIGVNRIKNNAFLKVIAGKAIQTQQNLPPGMVALDTEGNGDMEWKISNNFDWCINLKSANARPTNKKNVVTSMYDDVPPQQKNTNTINDKVRITITPNPSNGEFRIVSSLPMNQLFCFDLSGKLIESKQTKGVREYRYVSNLKTGAYTLEIHTAKTIVKQKIIVL